jgi:hypothetical protein
MGATDPTDESVGYHQSSAAPTFWAKPVELLTDPNNSSLHSTELLFEQLHPLFQFLQFVAHLGQAAKMSI